MFKVRKLARICAVPAWRRSLINHRVAAGVEHEVVLRHLADVRLIVDIGANRGQFALCARHCFAQSRIVSFEPLAGPAGVYRSLFANDNNIVLHEVAIGPEPGEATIHLSARDDSSSLLPISEAQDRLFPGTAEAGTTVIQISPLNSCLVEAEIDSPALLKLDVQGFELEALKGCESLLDRFTWVYAECSFVELYTGQALADAVIAWLHEKGLALTGVYNMSFDSAGKPIQADFLFARRR
jgi:FkbM family methyltransferase